MIASLDNMPPPFDSMWLRLLLGMIYGLALGSFVTMLSYRLPHHLSIVKPNSFCPVCKTQLKARDLFPVASWAMSGGACRHCGAKISARYPLIELVTGISCMAAFALIGFHLVQLIGAALAIVAIITVGVILLERLRKI